MIMVVPPAAADSVPVAQSSAVTVPPKGMSMWVWASMKPGMTSLPEASTVSASLTGRSVPTATIFSSSTRTSARKLPSAVTTVPPVKSNLLTAHSFPVSGSSTRGPATDTMQNCGRSGLAEQDLIPSPDEVCPRVAQTSPVRAVSLVREPVLRRRLPFLERQYMNGGAGCKPF